MSGIPPRPGRCSAEEKRRRVDELAAAVAGGETPLQALKRLAPTWGVTSRRNASRYSTALFATWERERRMSSRAALDVATAMRRRLYGLAVASGDFSAAARVLDGLEKLLGLDDRHDPGALDRVVAEVIGVIGDEVPDRDQRLRLLRRIESVMGGAPEPEPETPGFFLRDGGESRNGTAPH